MSAITDMLADGMEWLEGKRKDFMSSYVTYYRGAYSVQIAATKGRTVRERYLQDGAVIKYESVDWLVRTTELILNSVVVLPEPDDTIKQTAGGKVYTYRVLPNVSESCFRYSDPQRNTLRIHSKLESIEDA